MVSEASTAAPGNWSQAVYQALKNQGISVVGFVPDGGMKKVIELCVDYLSLGTDLGISCGALD